MSSRALAALRRGRRAAENLMLDTCRIQRVTGEHTDRTTGKVVPTYRDLYTGRCKIQSYEGHEQEREAVGSTATIQRLAVHLPVGAYRMEVGDVVTITAAGADPMMLGRRFRVAQEAPYKSLATAYRVFIDYLAD